MSPKANPALPSSQRERESGLTLVELMIAMVLGLFVIGGVISVTLSNSQTYRTNQALAQIQESTRSAFEILARETRQATAIGCGNTNRIANTLNAAGNWWQDWISIEAYAGNEVARGVAFGTNAGERVEGTDAIFIQGMQDGALSLQSHDLATATLKIQAAASDFMVGDILMVCDFDQATIFQASGYVSETVSIEHNVGVALEPPSSAPGNCTKGLGFPTECTAAGNAHPFPPNSQIGRISATTWYIGNNGRDDEGGRSLYRVRLGPGAVVVTEEIVAGITDMQLRFREGDAITLTSDPASWTEVTAVEFTMTLWSPEQLNAQLLPRTFMVGLRNRLE